MSRQREKTGSELEGKGVFTPSGEKPYEVAYYLEESESTVKGPRNYASRGGAEWQGTISPLPPSIKAPSEGHQLKLENGTVLNCYVKADRTVLCRK